MSAWIPGTKPVSFQIGLARHGWIALSVLTDDREASIACSDVYDPFDDLTRLFTGAVDGAAGSCEVDEEGPRVCIRIDCEPGALAGHLRIFRPGLFGEVEEMLLDAPVDILQIADAWYSTFTAYVGSYDPVHWSPGMVEEGEVGPRTLAKVELYGLRHALVLYGVREDNDLPVPNEFADLARARYTAAHLVAE